MSTITAAESAASHHRVIGAPSEAPIAWRSFRDKYGNEDGVRVWRSSRISDPRCARVEVTDLGGEWLLKARASTEYGGRGVEINETLDHSPTDAECRRWLAHAESLAAQLRLRSEAVLGGAA